MTDEINYDEISREGLIDMLEEATERLGEQAGEIKKLETRNEKFEVSLIAVLNWAKAYPIEVFPEPDMKFASQLLEAGGMTVGAISASAMRHLLKRITEIVNESLQEPQA